MVQISNYMSLFSHRERLLSNLQWTEIRKNKDCKVPEERVKTKRKPKNEQKKTNGN